MGGLVQFRIKKLVTYSTISHVGFLLLALSINSVESIQAFILYLSQYMLTNINVFFIIILIGYSLKNKGINSNLLDREHSPLQLISQLKGYFFHNPMLSLSFAITIFSLAGKGKYACCNSINLDFFLYRINIPKNSVLRTITLKCHCMRETL